VATVPDGYELRVFAAEPEVVNPIAFTLDDRSRVWVVEGMTYPFRAKEQPGTPAGLGGADRVLVFEDTDGDGKADKRTVFMEGLNLVSGIAVGHGGVYLGAAPYLLFVPVENWNDPKPKGTPEVLLDGWGLQDTHETLNTFHWGPDGWLYGCHGVFTQSAVGKPGTSAADRVKINAGIWRFEPEKKTFEVFGQGTSNPWGIDWNEDGELFAEACVIPHFFHIFDGGRYQRQAGAHFNPYTYDDIKTIADHRHYLGANPHGGNGKSDAAGGGHAHAGLCILQHPSWPENLRGGVLMGNIHGARINMDTLEKKGSGYIGHHGADFINFHDKASQIVDIREAADGSLFMIDWYDINQCHRTQKEAHDFTTGRIYVLAKKGAKIASVGPRKPVASKVEIPDAAKALEYAGAKGNAVQRRFAASACQRMTIDQRKPVVMALLAHAEDADDMNMPYMVWYAAEPIVAADPLWAAEALGACKIPKVTEFIARRMAAK
jgi:putative membrane-bound dehydrogenase-like protein